MADVFDVYDAQLAHIGGIPISPQQRQQLHKGEPITISYHTPRMLQAIITNPEHGSFDVIEAGGRLIVTDIEQVKRYIMLQERIVKAMKQPDKWIDPDAKSDSALR